MKLLYAWEYNDADYELWFNCGMIFIHIADKRGNYEFWYTVADVSSHIWGCCDRVRREFMGEGK